MSSLMTETLCICLHDRSWHGGNYRPPGAPDFRPMTCYGKDCPCDQMDVQGTCECGHPAGEHENINGRFVVKTPCFGDVLAPATMTGNIQRPMRCTCEKYSPKTEVTV
jgi:hypothetical protein